MCGIVAYNGKTDLILGTLIAGLKRLEYRGYDSAGIAVIGSKSIYVQKTVGKISTLQEAIADNPPKNGDHPSQ